MNKVFFAAALCGLLFASCSDEENAESETLESVTAQIRVNAEIQQRILNAFSVQTLEDSQAALNSVVEDIYAVYYPELQNFAFETSSTQVALALETMLNSKDVRVETGKARSGWGDCRRISVYVGNCEGRPNCGTIDPSNPGRWYFPCNN